MAPFNARYRIECRLGAGGMAEVYLARDMELERTVALKVMPADLAADPDKCKRFRSATKAASVLNHPNICVIHEVGETEDGRPFMAMEYVEGEPLDMILSRRSLRAREVIEIGVQVAEALDAAHSRGIVHRDIKPGNIMVGPRGQVKVLDFGLAKRFGEEAFSATATSVFKTLPGIMIGTPQYMSPEQALGHEVDGRTDIFSLGVVLYEALVGQKPFLGKTIGEVVNNVVNRQPEPLGLGSPVFSPALDDLVHKCLQKDPQQRYGSARELADALQDLKAKPKSETLEDRPSAARNDAAVQVHAPRPAGPPVFRTRTAILAGLGCFAVLLGAGLVWYRPWVKTGSGTARQAVISQKSVAVLPFNNFSADPESDYLSDGLTEEITAGLSRLPGLKVAARNSAYAFKGKNEDVRKVGQALGVSTLLEGSIRKDGNRIRVSAQLVNASTGYHLWSESYDRPLDDILAVQREIAERIAERLQGRTASAAPQVKAVNPEAYKAYLQARLCLNKRSPAGLRRAIELFQDALEKDPTYSPAQAGLAATYLLFPEYVFPARHSEYRPRAKAAAERALQLDPNCAEAHAVLGMLMVHPAEAKIAEEHYQRAIELSPNFATAHHWYGNFLTFQGRLEQALVQYRIAMELDPLTAVTQSTLAQWHYYNQDYATAIAEARKVIEKFPEFLRIREICVLAQLQKGDYVDALAEVEQARLLEPDMPLAMLEYRAFGLARLGREPEARDIQARFEEALRQGQPAEGRLTLVYAGLREYDKLIDMLEIKNANEGLDPMILRDPFCRELLDLPRFRSLLQRAGIEPPAQKRA